MSKNLDPDQERNLVQRARSEREAFQALYAHYFPRIYAYIAYRVGRERDVEDLVADVFVRIIEALPGFEYRGPGSFTAWIFRIAHNRVIGFLRLHRHRAEAVSLDQIPEIHSSIPLPDDLLQQKETFLRLRDQIRTLSPRRQEIITLRFYGGLRNREIAVVLGLDERTVASHLSRALEDLQHKYADEFYKRNAP